MHRTIRLISVLLASVLFSRTALAQGEPADASMGLWSLFVQSFDLFSVVLIAGSLTAVAVIVRVVMDVRPGSIAPADTTRRIQELTGKGRFGEVREFCKKDGTFVANIVLAAIRQSDRGSDAAHEAAEFEASLECAKWFRKIELLNVIGNLGPLVGLAGTVWGMILAFNSLGQSGGDAGPAALSLGISKALFHTLLGLVLAIPCLLVFGIYRSIIDRVCTTAMADAARLIGRLPAGDAEKGESGES